ncbi:N-acetyltransferase [Sorangium sp. So ce1036]|uniref:GNAT family N-acetyltransferase n=1 Tax=Sorangium sp. So ce1036 TaxID=3133328 RepID=UPI003F099ADD
MDVKIRDEEPSEAGAIEAMTVAVFRGATHGSHTEHFIVNALREAGQLVLSLVAEVDGAIVGHVAVSPVSISDGAEGWYGLGPISVAPDRQGQGIGSQLMKRALAELRRLGAAGCVVLGDPSYYGRFGFKAEPTLVLPDVPPEYFQAIALRGAVPSGRVSYHPAFNAEG